MMGFGIRCVAAFRIAPPNTRIGLEAVSAGPEMMEHHIARSRRRHPGRLHRSVATDCPQQKTGRRKLFLIARIICGVEGGLQSVGNPNFFVNIVQVGFYRVRADTHVIGYSLVAGACRQQLEDLIFTLGKRWDAQAGYGFCRGTKNAAAQHLPSKPEFTVQYFLDTF